MIIDGMDMDTLITFASIVSSNIETWTEDEVKGEILDLYDEETLEGLMPTDVIEVLRNGVYLKNFCSILAIK